MFNAIVFSLVFAGSLFLGYFFRQHSVATLSCFAVAFIVYFYFQRFLKFHWNSKLKLSYDSLSYDGWESPLKFEDIDSMQMMSNNGIESLNIKLKKKIKNPAKNPLFFKNVKSVTIVISSFRGKNADMISKIYSYFTRQI